MPEVESKNRQEVRKERTVKKSDTIKRSIKVTTPGGSSEAILKIYKPLFENDNQIVARAQEGLKISAVTDFSILSLKNQKEIAELIHTTPKTLQNYNAGSKRLPTLQSELLLKLFALYAKGLEIFKDVKSFNGWLKVPAFGLYHEVPAILLTTSTGMTLVMDELIRIEYGDFA